MAEYSIGEVESLTGLKAHVLRYWEDTVPFIRPRKDDRGRRVYSSRDVELISRVKRLVHEEKYTLEGAGERLLGELTGAETPESEGVGPGAVPRSAEGASRDDGNKISANAPAGPVGPDPAAARAAIDALRAELMGLYRMVKKDGEP